MSTRCHTIVKKNDKKVYVYRHSDGYPSGAGEDLKSFVEDNKDDIYNWSVNDFVVELYKYDGGFEIDNNLHGDENYVYIVNLDTCSIKGYHVEWDVLESDIENSENLEFDYEW